MIRTFLISFIFVLTSFSLVLAEARAIDKVFTLGIKNGEVDYAYIKSRKEILEKHLKALAKADVESMSAVEKKSFYINAYNVFTLSLMARHYPLKSIKDIPSSKRWSWKGWDVAGQKVSLDDIEHKMLRPMGDPRIHFAINCASFSCPVLASEPYEADQLDQLLNEATKNFLEDEQRGLNFAQRKAYFGFGDEVEDVYVSKIFNWFGEDFIKSHGSVIAFIRAHVSEKVKQRLTKLEDKDLRFLDYDWSINGK
jgi:hypothetical protein